MAWTVKLGDHLIPRARVQGAEEMLHVNLRVAGVAAAGTQVKLAGRVAEGVAFYEEAADACPAYAPAHYNIGVVFRRASLCATECRCSGVMQLCLAVACTLCKSRWLRLLHVSCSEARDFSNAKKYYERCGCRVCHAQALFTSEA